MSRGKRKIVTFVFYSFLGAFLFWSVGFAGFAEVSLGQESMPLPQPLPPENSSPYPANGVPTEPQAPQPNQTSPLVAPTFEEDELPPRNYKPPVYKERDSKAIETYRLDVGDVVNIIILDFPEFNASGAIDRDGMILLPYLGKMPLLGLTLDEVQDKLAYELGRRFLKEKPEVIASLVAARPVQLTLVGEIVRPGFYTLPPETSIVSVLLSAGGATPKANLRSIIVRRPLHDGTVVEETVDLYTPLLKGEKVPNFRLQGGDTVIVSKLEFGQEQGYDRRLISRTNLVQPTITVRVLVPSGGNNNSGISLRNINVRNGSTFLDVVANLPNNDPLRVNFNEVTLLRFDPQKGRVVEQELSPLGAIEGDLAQDVPLQDQDVIVVSRTLLGKLLSAFSTVTQPVRDVFGFSNFVIDLPNRVQNLGNGGNGRFGF